MQLRAALAERAQLHEHGARWHSSPDANVLGVCQLLPRTLTPESLFFWLCVSHASWEIEYVCGFRFVYNWKHMEILGSHPST